MGKVIKVDFERKGYEALNDVNRAKAEGLAAGLLRDNFKAIYNALEPAARATVDNYIADLLRQQRREAQTV